MASRPSSLAADGRGGCSTQCGDVSWWLERPVERQQFAKGAMAITPFFEERIRKRSDGTFKISDGSGTSFLKQSIFFWFHCSLGGLGPTAGKGCTFVVF